MRTLLLFSVLLTTSCAFTHRPLFGSAAAAGAQRHASSFSRRSSADDFSLNELKKELSRRRAAEEESRLQAQPDSFMDEQMVLRKKLLRAFVLVFNQGQQEEGVYTLFSEGRNVLRAWQDKGEAARYALMLRAEDLPLGKPTELPMLQIIGFCKDNEVGLEIIPTGRALQPPSINKPQIDFDYSKSSSQDQGSSSSSRRRGRGPSAAAAGTGQTRRDDSSLFTPQELARIKERFEKSLEGISEEE